MQLNGVQMQAMILGTGIDTYLVGSEISRSARYQRKHPKLWC